MVIGRHSDDMICLPRYCSVAGVPLPLLLPPEKIAALVEETRTAGDLVVELAKRSSAYYAPSAAIAELADSVHMNLNRVFSRIPGAGGRVRRPGCRAQPPGVHRLPRRCARVSTPELTPQEIAVLRESARKITAAVSGTPVGAAAHNDGGKK